MGPLLTGLVNVGKAILPGLFGAGQSVIEARQQRKNIEMQNVANKQLAEYQYNKQLEMWNRQNEYNSPSSQMQRFNQAGLNPNLIYGQGNAGNATQLPKYEAPQLSYDYKAPVDLSSVLATYQDYQIRNAQLDNLKEQNRIIRANAEMKEVDTAFYQNYLGAKYPGIGAQKYYKGANELEKQQLEIKKLNLENEIKQKTINWWIADKVANYSTRALGGLGLSRLLGGFGKGKGEFRSGSNYYVPKELSRSITKYYR